MPWEDLGSGHQIAWHALYGCQCNFGTTSIYSAYTFNLGNLEYEWNFKGSAFEELLNLVLKLISIIVLFRSSNSGKF